MANVSRAAVRGVDLATAEKIIDYALKVARQKKLRPMTLAVLDAGGDLVAFKREDGTGIRRFDVVMGKAFGSLVMNRPSRVIGKIGENNPLFIQSLAVATQGRLVPTPGSSAPSARRAMRPMTTRRSPSRRCARPASYPNPPSRQVRNEPALRRRYRRSRIPQP
jgi:uncharacterized protein GlcG (DUF336 family)